MVFHGTESVFLFILRYLPFGKEDDGKLGGDSLAGLFHMLLSCGMQRRAETVTLQEKALWLFCLVLVILWQFRLFFLSKLPQHPESAFGTWNTGLFIPEPCVLNFSVSFLAQMCCYILSLLLSKGAFWWSGSYVLLTEYLYMYMYSYTYTYIYISPYEYISR